MEFLLHLWQTLVGLLQHLWNNFLSLHPWGYAIAAVIALFTFIKGKAISAAVSTAWKKLSEWFWNKVRIKVIPQSQTPQTGQAQARTYTGTFHGYNQYANFPHSFFFTISGNGFTTKVPVAPTQLFSGVQSGTYIEIDTEAIPGRSLEIVKRVRIDATA